MQHLRPMEVGAGAAVIVLLRQMQVQTLLEAALQDPHLKLKVMRTPIMVQDLVAVLVSVIHLLGALTLHPRPNIITNTIITTKTKLVEESTANSASMAVEDLDQEEVELVEDNLGPAAMQQVKQVDLIKDTV